MKHVTKPVDTIYQCNIKTRFIHQASDTSIAYGCHTSIYLIFRDLSKWGICNLYQNEGMAFAQS